MRREDRDAFADAARARRDADAVVEENIREETLARVMRVERPRERDVAADEARVDAARRAARRARATRAWRCGSEGTEAEGTKAEGTAEASRSASRTGASGR